MMHDAGSSRFSAFDDEPWVIQAIRNVVLNIEDNYCDLSVPEAYASPQLLLEALQGLRELADRQLVEVEALNERLGSKWYHSIRHAHQINREVREAIDHAFTLSTDAAAAQEAPIERLRKIATRLPRVARQLLDRRKDAGIPRPTLKIGDEYDVQDLLHAVLWLYFNDIRDEEWCPSYAGSSKRTDFLLNTESIFIEVKLTGKTHGQKKIVEELIIDIANYRNHPNCRHLFCLVWDTEGLLENPVGLKADLEKSNAGFVTIAIAS